MKREEFIELTKKPIFVRHLTELQLRPDVQFHATGAVISALVRGAPQDIDNHTYHQIVFPGVLEQNTLLGGAYETAFSLANGLFWQPSIIGHSGDNYVVKDGMKFVDVVRVRFTIGSRRAIGGYDVTGKVSFSNESGVMCVKLALSE